LVEAAFMAFIGKFKQARINQFLLGQFRFRYKMF